MEKNENGYPLTHTRVENNGTSMDENSGIKYDPDRQGGCQGGGCSGSGCVDQLEPAYVYAPSQKFCMLFSNDEALWHGTLFEQLYKPMGVYGNE